VSPAEEAGDPVRIAVIGAGRMGSVHLEALRLSRTCMAVAAVDPDAAARDAAGAHVARTHATVSELLATGGFDGVLIASPSGLHRQTVEEVAGAGVPMLCEKPCGLDVDDVRAASRAAAEAGSLLQIGYWRRFVPELVALRERIADGSLGRPQLIMSHQWDEHLPSSTFRSGSGGIAADMAVHEVDQIRWLTGEDFEVVSAVGAGGEPVADVRDPDNAVVLGRLSGGAGAVLTLGRRFPPGDSCWVEVFGEDGYERATFMWAAAGEAVFHRALAAQADAFAAAVRGGPQRGATGDDAIAALAAAEQIADALAGTPRQAVAP
jgi:myo-inositol 2-dehydrogenase/D-chiro-inositol 1-dehydrogenase